MVVSSYPLYSGVIGSGQRWSSSLSRPPTKKEHKDRQACVYVCMREKNPCEPVRTGANRCASNTGRARCYNANGFTCANSAIGNHHRFLHTCIYSYYSFKMLLPCNHLQRQKRIMSGPLASFVSMAQLDILQTKTLFLDCSVYFPI